MTQTTRKRLIASGAVLYLLLPLLFGILMYVLLINDAFPPEADAIMIPIAGFVVMWICAIPVAVVVLGSIELVGREFESK